MAIKRFLANKDNTITDAFKENLATSASLSNMGASDVLEIFSIYGQATTSSIEKSRILIDFPISSIQESRTSGDLPASGSVTFKLKLFNARHAETVPKDYTISVHPLTADWSEGVGLDMESYKDKDASNWLSSSHGTSWTTPGGDINYTQEYRKDTVLSTGTENLDVDISNIVEDWIKGDINQYGMVVRLSGSAEDGSLERSFYTKRFFARGSEFFFKRPIIEAQYDDSTLDDRSKFFKSSSLVPASDNLNNIFLYNKHRGQYVDLPDIGQNLVVQILTASNLSSALTLPVAGGVTSASPTFVTASKVATGIYKAQFCYTGSVNTLYDVWSKSTNGVSTTLLSGGVINVVAPTTPDNYETPEYVTNITNMKDTYTSREVAKFRVYTRNKKWKPNIYTSARNSAPVDIVREAYYKISRVADDLEIIGFSTGSTPSYSRMSYDVSGSFFEVDMSILEPNYLYEISFMRKDGSHYIEQDERFRFRVS